jgi:hypothetical protein
MRPSSLPIAVLLLSACAAAPRADPTLPAAPRACFTYRAALGSEIAAADLRLGVRVPCSGPVGELRELSAYGIVGNAPFDVPIPLGESGAHAAGPLEVSWRALDSGQASEVSFRSAGRPLEVALRLAFEPTPAVDEAALEAELRGATEASVDARRVAVTAARLVRVR